MKSFTPAPLIFTRNPAESGGQPVFIRSITLPPHLPSDDRSMTARCEDPKLDRLCNYLKWNAEIISQLTNYLLARHLDSSGLYNLNEAYSNTISGHMKMLTLLYLSSESDHHPNIPPVATVLDNIDKTFDDYAKITDTLSSSYSVLDKDIFYCHMKATQGVFHSFMWINLGALSLKIDNNEKRQKVGAMAESHRKAAGEFYAAAHKRVKDGPGPRGPVHLNALLACTLFNEANGYHDKGLSELIGEALNEVAADFDAHTCTPTHDLIMACRGLYERLQARSCSSFFRNPGGSFATRYLLDADDPALMPIPLPFSEYPSPDYYRFLYSLRYDRFFYQY